ncbi:TetR/AcrR family transcriptional regulator [Qipengyuania atrilutea]|uniref:TetR/AcrR family transcriptional regulator n=1 Tax=Qipengyuania atrilutea TaxID=2744473 RepID=A0A850H2D6_9SPHN|nr:TetR/AcrR family transcriptional regulator [Actirhodobacter atriluteus]NVD44730.1 TetR/AcrR family transcriptional regulator [Actirhodobacter atriluteus]
MFSAAECCRLDRRRRALIAAARELFVEQGYEKTALSEIVERSGGSLATVYKLFGNKEGILEAVVFEKVSSGAAMVDEAASGRGTPAEILRRLAGRFRTHFLDPETIALVRIVIARSINDKKFAQQFFERTATRTLDALTALFRSWKADGVRMSGEPEILAELFLGLFVSDVHTEAISHGLGSHSCSKRFDDRIGFFLIGAGLAEEQLSPS